MVAAFKVLHACLRPGSHRNSPGRSPDKLSAARDLPSSAPRGCCAGLRPLEKIDEQSHDVPSNQLVHSSCSPLPTADHDAGRTGPCQHEDSGRRQARRPPRPQNEPGMSFVINPMPCEAPFTRRDSLLWAGFEPTPRTGSAFRAAAALRSRLDSQPWFWRTFAACRPIRNWGRNWAGTGPEAGLERALTAWPGGRMLFPQYGGRIPRRRPMKPAPIAGEGHPGRSST